jgi:hypothetical protein
LIAKAGRKIGRGPTFGRAERCTNEPARKSLEKFAFQKGSGVRARSRNARAVGAPADPSPAFRFKSSSVFSVSPVFE